jgi:hypothetical protein
MPNAEGNRYPKDVVAQIFAAANAQWNDPVSRLKYVGPALTNRIMAAMQVQQEPSMAAVVVFIVDEAAGLMATNVPGFQGAGGGRKAIEAVVSDMTLSPRALMCTSTYRIRLVNRFGFNVLVDLLAHAKENPPPLPPATAAALAAIVPDSLRRDSICGFNEGSYTSGAPNASGVLAPANSPFLCAVNARSTNKASQFGARLRRCPCLQQQSCSASPDCVWLPGDQKCAARVVHQGSNRKLSGVQYRSRQTGVAHSDYRRSVQNAPPASVSIPQGVAQGGAPVKVGANNHFYV